MGSEGSRTISRKTPKRTKRPLATAGRNRRNSGRDHEVLKRTAKAQATPKAVRKASKDSPEAIRRESPAAAKKKVRP